MYGSQSTRVEERTRPVVFVYVVVSTALMKENRTHSEKRIDGTRRRDQKFLNHKESPHKTKRENGSKPLGDRK